MIIGAVRVIFLAERSEISLICDGGTFSRNSAKEICGGAFVGSVGVGGCASLMGRKSTRVSSDFPEATLCGVVGIAPRIENRDTGVGEVAGVARDDR